MSFSFFKARPKTPQEVAKATKDSLVLLDSVIVVEFKALEKALEEVEKNFSAMKSILCGDGESDPNPDQIEQLALEICKEDVIADIVHKILTFGWQARKDLVQCWSVLFKQPAETTHCCVQYIESHLDLLDFLVMCCDNRDVALTCGNMLRECIKFPSLARYMLNSPSFQLFFKYIEFPNFDVSSDAFCTLKDLLTRHNEEVAEYVTFHFDEFFGMYEQLLTSSNYVIRRQSLKLLSDILFEPRNLHIMKRYILELRYMKVIMTLLKDSSKNIRLSAFDIFKMFVANPNKPREITIILAKNCEKLLHLLNGLTMGRGSDDDVFEEEKELVMKEIEQAARLFNYRR